MVSFVSHPVSTVDRRPDDIVDGDIVFFGDSRPQFIYQGLSVPVPFVAFRFRPGMRTLE